jgi:hypothetical protein
MRGASSPVLLPATTVRRRLFFFLLLLLLLGCGAPAAERQAVEAVAVKREQAINGRDLPLYLSLLSPAYRDRGRDYAAEKRVLEESLRAPGKTGYRSLDRRITVSGRQAVIRGRYRLTIGEGGQEVNLEGEEELRLVKEG